MLSLPINKQLGDLQVWQQNVFCMALAERTRLHFQMFCEAVDNEAHLTVNSLNQLFWEKMTVKGTKVNFTIQQENFETCIPDSRDFDFYGVYPAIDHCVILSCTFNSFLTKSNEEALNASQTSFSTIASFIELQADQEITEDQLKEQELFIDELNFQQHILTQLENPRSPELIKAIRESVTALGCTSLGIALED